MKTIINIVLTLAVSLLFLACASSEPTATTQATNGQMPKWVFTPNQDGIIGAVGSAKTHFKGSAAQRDLAIQRALNELAKQHGVQVHTESSQNQTSNNGMVNSKVGNYSFQTSDGVVNAHIAEVWQDPKSKEIFIWMRDN